MTTGRVYQSVIERERNLGYGGKCVEVVPHVPMEINNRIKKAARKSKADFVLIGTPVDLRRILKINKPMLKVNYEVEEFGKPTLVDVLDGFLRSHKKVKPVLGKMGKKK